MLVGIYVDTPARLFDCNDTAYDHVASVWSVVTPKRLYEYYAVLNMYHTSDGCINLLSVLLDECSVTSDVAFTEEIARNYYSLLHFNIIS
jgi:hypothetical protein